MLQWIMTEWRRLSQNHIHNTEPWVSELQSTSIPMQCRFYNDEQVQGIWAYNVVRVRKKIFAFLKNNLNNLRIMHIRTRKKNVHFLGKPTSVFKRYKIKIFKIQEFFLIILNIFVRTAWRCWTVVKWNIALI